MRAEMSRSAAISRTTRALARGALGLDRARDPQPDHRRQEPGAADGRGPAARSRTSSTRSVALEELDRVERSISHLLRFAREEELRLARREARRTWSTPRSRRCRERDRARAASTRARATSTGRRARRRRREAAPRVHQPGRQRASTRSTSAARRRRASTIASARTWRAPRSGCASRDNGPGIDRRDARAHLQPVLHHQGERHRASAWRSRGRSSRRTAARSRSSREPGAAPSSCVTLPEARPQRRRRA